MHRDHGKQILNVENLSYKNEAGVYLFKDVTFTLMPGEKMVVLSNDDIAKTKLLEIISGVTKPTEGTVTW
ncbi:cytochrome c biogenesis protein CcmA, partial [Mycoplasmopsis synoviae]